VRQGGREVGSDPRRGASRKTEVTHRIFRGESPRKRGSYRGQRGTYRSAWLQAGDLLDSTER
jgi:hypothetical protein